MLWRASIDDSADRNREKVVISACLIGDSERWRDLAHPWKVTFAENNLNYFKSSECAALSGEFLQFRSEQKYPKPIGREAADKIRDGLDQIIKNSGVRGIGVIVPVPVFNKIYALVIPAEAWPPSPLVDIALAFYSPQHICVESSAYSPQSPTIIYAKYA